MYKTVSFNVFDLELEDIVYKNEKKRSSENSKINNRASKKMPAANETPIPKPIEEFWRKPLNYNNQK